MPCGTASQTNKSEAEPWLHMFGTVYQLTSSRPTHCQPFVGFSTVFYSDNHILTFSANIIHQCSLQWLHHLDHLKNCLIDCLIDSLIDWQDTQCTVTGSRLTVSSVDCQVLDFGWPDTLAPPLERLCNVCKSIESWLNTRPSNVVLLHCKTGLSRLAVVIAAYRDYHHNVCSTYVQQTTCHCVCSRHASMYTITNHLHCYKITRLCARIW